MNWSLIQSGTGAPAWNMAMDDALLQHAAELGRPVLRFYGWTTPAATLGYFQKITEIEQATLLRPLIRRPTGGGLVPHLNDWTYSFVVPPAHDWYSLRAEESYRRMHAWIQQALVQLGVETELAGCCRKELPGQCFAGYEKSDVLRTGRKIAGAAQRRNKLGLLIQGSIQPPPPEIAHTAFVESMKQAGRAQLGEVSGMLDVQPLVPTIERMIGERYGNDRYNRRR